MLLASGEKNFVAMRGETDSALALRKIPVVNAFASLHSAKIAEDYLVLKLDATSFLEATVYVDGTESADEGSGIPIITAAHQHESSVTRGTNQLLSFGPLGQHGPEPPTDGFSIGLQLRNPGALPEDVSRMYWYGTILTDTEIQWTRQKVVRGDKTHQSHALFGSPKPDVSDGDECVICLTNPKEVVILHCRHVCLCQACSTITSSTWSYQCPVCRGRVSAMCAVADC
eukprot:GEMP01070256.1.p1 GENE.GEMP01070256.1~~GEMP01070256.1.p1  ORF type:complete len:228 (+),score=11.36 GEMP01070256.1:488-1171(+)